jgi:hypothetical protein
MLLKYTVETVYYSIQCKLNLALKNLKENCIVVFRKIWAKSEKKSGEGTRLEEYRYFVLRFYLFARSCLINPHPIQYALQWAGTQACKKKQL